MRRLRYSVAATLDGFIAAIFDEFDTFVMGRKTWDVSAPSEFADMFGGKNVTVPPIFQCSM